MTKEEILSKLRIRLRELGSTFTECADGIRVDQAETLQDPVFSGLVLEFHKAHAKQELATSKARIWRYMDFAKFISLLSRKVLWFARADKMLDDPLEACTVVFPYDAPAMPTSGEQIYSAVAETAYQQLNHLRQKSFINCWIKRQDQSIAMWKLYASYNRGVAIQSTIERLKRSITLPAEVDKQLLHFQSVRYTDDLKREPQRDLARSVPIAFSQIIQPAFVKRLCFDYEEEWRAVLFQCNADLSHRQDDGVELDVDLEQLIEEIWVAPVAEAFFKEAVDSVMKVYGLNRGAKKLDWPTR